MQFSIGLVSGATAAVLWYVIGKRAFFRALVWLLGRGD